MVWLVIGLALLAVLFAAASLRERKALKTAHLRRRLGLEVRP